MDGDGLREEISKYKKACCWMMAGQSQTTGRMVKDAACVKTRPRTRRDEVEETIPDAMEDLHIQQEE